MEHVRYCFYADIKKVIQTNMIKNNFLIRFKEKFKYINTFFSVVYNKQAIKEKTMFPTF